MRGSRVKNIVKELQGEKIDIVRWSDDTKEYVLAALNPAKISTIKLDKESKTAQVTVDDDQLSLAIGKKGQNVRLASKLTGWEIDIKPKTPAVEGAAKAAAEAVMPELSAKEESGDISSVEGVGAKTKALLEGAGLSTIAKIAESSVEELTKIKGIGEKTAEKILKSAKELAKK